MSSASPSPFQSSPLFYCSLAQQRRLRFLASYCPVRSPHSAPATTSGRWSWRGALHITSFQGVDLEERWLDSEDQGQGRKKKKRLQVHAKGDVSSRLDSRVDAEGKVGNFEAATLIDRSTAPGYYHTTRLRGE